MARYEIELACDQHEGAAFAAWLREQGHRASVGRTTGGSIIDSDDPQAFTDDPEAGRDAFESLWLRYCDS